MLNADFEENSCLPEALDENLSKTLTALSRIELMSMVSKFKAYRIGAYYPSEHSIKI